MESKMIFGFFQENRGFKFTTVLCKGSEHHDSAARVETVGTSWKYIKWRFTGKPKLWLKSGQKIHVLGA